MSDLIKEYRKTMDAEVLHLWAADAVAEIARLRAEAEFNSAAAAESMALACEKEREADALRVDAEALARVKDLVRATRRSVSDAYENACRNGDERAQSVCNARTSLLNNIDAAMGSDA